MISRIIIIGGHIQALGLARQAHQLGLEVLLYLSEPFSVSRWSNSVNHVIRGSMDEFLELIKPYSGKNTLLFPTNDEAVELLAKHRNMLEEEFVLGIPSNEVVNTFSEKRFTARFAAEKGIPHPKCFCPNSMEEIVSRAHDFSYPVVVKPSVMYVFHRQFRKKAILCKNMTDLLDCVRDISKCYPIDQLLIQEYLQGGPKMLYSFGVFSIDGEPKSWIMAHRIRQNPMNFGNSTTYAYTCQIPEIEAMARKILSETRYSGLAEIEFMYNQHNKRYEMLEINTRAWKWHTLSETVGFGFLSEMIRFLNGEPSQFKPQEGRFAWIESLTDSAVCFKEVLHGRMAVKEICKSKKMPKHHAVWSCKDPLPAIMYLLLSPILFFTRH